MPPRAVSHASGSTRRNMNDDEQAIPRREDPPQQTASRPWQMARLLTGGFRSVPEPGRKFDIKNGPYDRLVIRGATVIDGTGPRPSARSTSSSRRTASPRCEPLAGVGA